jgi:type II secretory ATPase GspE/PulE/Tfp pilus assembly ATPase PilB-like protein
MGIPPYLVSSALVGVVAQRLLRRVCKYCKEQHPAIPEEMVLLGLDPNQDPVTLVRAKGCQNCNNTGYSGREGIFELMPLTEEMKEVVARGAGIDDLKKAMRDLKMPTLYSAACKKILEQKTTVEELMRVVPPTAK